MPACVMCYIYLFLILLDEFRPFLTILLDEVALLLHVCLLGGGELCLIVVSFFC